MIAMKEIQNKEAPENAGQGAMLTPPVSEQDHVQGLAVADITLVQYGDYNSARCAAVQPWVRALQSQMGTRLRYVFRHFPKTNLHPHAAEAAEAAGRQGRFWEMHDILFAHYLALGSGFLVEYADDLGLNTRRFLRDMTQDVSLDRVLRDRESGVQSGVLETPTFFVNGLRQHGSWAGRGSWGEDLLWEVALLPSLAALPKASGNKKLSGDEEAAALSKESHVC